MSNISSNGSGCGAVTVVGVVCVHAVVSKVDWLVGLCAGLGHLHAQKC